MGVKLVHPLGKNSLHKRPIEFCETKATRIPQKHRIRNRNSCTFIFISTESNYLLLNRVTGRVELREFSVEQLYSTKMVRAVHRLFKLTHSNVVKQLPKPYLDYLEKSRAPRERVVDKPPETKYLDYNQDHETGYVYRTPDHPIHVVRPAQSEKGLWGGLGMVEGFEKPKKLKPRINRLWWPSIEKHTFYSDILDVHINIEVTDRTLELIDKHQGFDYYILKTPVQDLASELGRRLQHKMLLALATDQRELIKEKYKEFIRPLDEVTWHGLNDSEALIKFRLMRVEESIEPPLKVTYAKQLIEELKSKKSLEAS